MKASPRVRMGRPTARPVGVGGLASLGVPGVTTGGSSGLVDLPLTQPTAALPSSFGDEWFVDDYPSFLTAINNSQIGDVITVDHTAARIQPPTGTTVSFPVKAGAGPGAYVTIRTDAWASLPSLPSNGLAPDPLTTANNPRVRLSHASLLGKFRVPPGASTPVTTAPFLRMAPGSGGLYLWGLDIDCAPDSASTFALNGMLRFGEVDPALGWDALSDIPHDVVVQQCYIHTNASGAYGNPADFKNCGKAISSYCDSMAVVNSTIVCESTQNPDSNAIWVGGAHGNILVDNNTLVGSGENFFTGGNDSPSWMTGIVPSDITVTRNHLYKPDIWMPGVPGYGGVTYAMKNPLELKMAIRALIERNILDGNCSGQQNGQGFSLKCGNQGQNMNWVETGHITFRKNLTRRVGAGYVISYLESGACTGGSGYPVHDVDINNNLTIVDATYSGSKRHNLFTQGCRYAAGRLALTANINMRHETFLGPGTYIYGGTVSSGAPTDVTIQDCIFAYANPASYFGVKGDSLGEGDATLNASFENATLTFDHNVLTARSSGSYSGHPGNFFPSNDTVTKIDPATGDLLAGSPCLAGGAWQASDGLDNGCDLVALNAGIAGVDLGGD